VIKEAQSKKNINTIFEHLNRLLICGAVMAGGAAIAKFNKLITTSFPEASIVAGIVVAFTGLFLTVWVAVDGWIEIGEIYKSKIKGLIYGGLYVFLAVSMVMALFFSAINA